MRFGRAAFLHFGSQLALSVAGFVGTFVIARELGAGTLGVYVTVVALMFWLKVPADGVARAVTKRTSENATNRGFITAGFLVNAGYVAVISVVVSLGSDYVEHYVGGSVSGLLIALLASNIFFDVVARSLQGRKQIVERGWLQVAERVLRVGLQIGFILLAFGVSGLLVGHTLSLFVAGLAGLVVLNARFAVPSRTTFRELIRYGRYSWLGSLQGRMFGWMDTIVLAFFVSSALVGIYEVAWTLASTLILISRSVRGTLFPEFSDLGVDRKYQQIHHYLDEALVFTGIFAIPGLFGAAVLGPRLLGIYRPEFARGSTILLILILARMVQAYGSQLRSAINGVDRPDVAFRLNAVFVALNGVLNVALVFQFGWMGAAVATFSSAVVYSLLAYWYLAGIIGRPSFPLGEIARQIVAGLVMVAVLLVAKPLVPVTHYGTIGLVMASTLVYALAITGLSHRVRGKVGLLWSGFTPIE